MHPTNSISEVIASGKILASGIDADNLKLFLIAYPPADRQMIERRFGIDVTDALSTSAQLAKCAHKQIGIACLRTARVMQSALTASADVRIPIDHKIYRHRVDVMDESNTCVLHIMVYIDPREIQRLTARTLMMIKTITNPETLHSRN